MNEYVVFWSFDSGKTLEHIGYEKLDDDGNYVFKRINTDTKELRKDWHLGMITDNQGNAKFYRFPFIGKTDIEGEKIYADSSIVEFATNDLGWQKGYFTYNENGLNYQFNSKDGALLTDWMEIRSLKVIGTLQENPELLGEN